MSREIRGIGVASGVAIGRAHLLAPSELEVRQFNIERHDVLHEVARLNNAFSLVRAELDSMRDAVAPSAPPEVRAFLDLHRIILDDSLLSDVPRDLVRQRLINAEWALTIQLEEVCRQFESISDEYFRERSQDVRQVVDRILKALAGGRGPAAILPRKVDGQNDEERMILIAHDLAPTDMLQLRERADSQFAGFVTELGGPTSHTAILARSLGLPAVVGASDARAHVTEGAWIVMDAGTGTLIIDPDSATLAHFRGQLREENEQRTQLRKLKGKIARTVQH